jgi:D-3-phosphoglycerate dehydrogenase
VSETSYPLDKIKVVLLEGVHERGVELLEAAGYTVEWHKGALGERELLEATADAHLVGIRSKTHLSRAFFENAGRLWGVGCFCIGTNQVDLAAAAERGVAVFNAPFSNTRSVAELVIAETVALHRRLTERSAELHAGRWRKSAAGAHEIRGRTMGIVGYGRIGSQVSVLAEAMGMKVVYHDVTGTLPLGNADRLGSLEDVLRAADCVTLHVPATEQTNNMIGERELSLMKPGAFLINNARGSVVDIDALRAALESGRLGGAAIDVFPEEPAAREDAFETPLAGLPNVILTPHVGGSTVEAQQNIAEEVGNKLVRLINNGSTATSVNVPAVELPQLHASHHRVLHYHRNVPGVLQKLNSVIADSGANVAAQFLQSDMKHSYVIMDVQTEDSEAIKAGLRDIEETIRVRVLW